MSTLPIQGSRPVWTPCRKTSEKYYIGESEVARLRWQDPEVRKGAVGDLRHVLHAAEVAEVNVGGVARADVAADGGHAARHAAVRVVAAVEEAPCQNVTRY